jgi:hypothetical protein
VANVRDLLLITLDKLFQDFEQVHGTIQIQTLGQENCSIHSSLIRPLFFFTTIGTF